MSLELEPPCYPPTVPPVPRDDEDASMRARVVSLADVAEVTDQVEREGHGSVLTTSCACLRVRQLLERRARMP